MKRFTTLFICLGTSLAGIAQNVGIGTNTPNASALLELQSTNKGLLLPRVADTNAIASPAKGLIVFSNASNSLWFYNGSSWHTANSGGGNNENIWQAIGDNIATTGRKFVQINPNDDVPSQTEGLAVDGSLLIQQKFTATKAAPTAAQTQTMNNSSTIYTWPNDSTGRIFEPGGANNNYINNVQGNILVFGRVNVSFNAADFGIAAGDTLWIGNSSFPACRTNYTKRYTNTNTAPPSFNVDGLVYFSFRSNADNLNGKGFDISFKILYSVTSIKESLTPVGNALTFDVGNGAFRAGKTKGSIGSFSTATGIDNTASGYSSIAMGNSSSAIGFSSTAVGNDAFARGEYSVSIGNYSNANGTSSIAIGHSTNSSSAWSTAIGSFNDPLSGTNEDVWISTDPLLYIGNGSPYTGMRSNSMVIYKNANVDINGYTSLGKLSESAPRVKMKELMVTSAAGSNSQATVNHGIDPSKIISVSTLMEWSTGYFAPPEYSPDPLLRYNYFISPTQIVIQNNAANCAYICSKQVKILITYKE